MQKAGDQGVFDVGIIRNSFQYGVIRFVPALP